MQEHDPRYAATDGQVEPIAVRDVFGRRVDTLSPLERAHHVKRF